jgi:hypothetical protein
MDFNPQSFTETKTEIPFFEDITSEGGWKGHATQKNYLTLKSEVIAALSNLGATITSWVEGKFAGKHHRLGIKINFIVDLGNQKFAPGVLIVAALPVRPLKPGASRTQIKSYEHKEKKSLRMALFNIVLYFQAMHNLKMLSPGSEPLVPWLIVPGEEAKGRTFSDMLNAERALPSGEEETVEGEFKEI